MHEIEPFYGWAKFYTSVNDEYSPFYGVDYNEFHFDRQVYQYLAHPQWDTIDSESLLVKVIYADYFTGNAFVELFGVWNDLLENDYRKLVEHCLEPLQMAGIQRFVLIMENVLNIYLEGDDYYEAFQENLEDGWVCLLRSREHVIRELQTHGIAPYFFWSDALDELNWRKLKPEKLMERVIHRVGLLLN